MDERKVEHKVLETIEMVMVTLTFECTWPLLSMEVHLICLGCRRPLILLIALDHLEPP